MGSVRRRQILQFGGATCLLTAMPTLGSSGAGPALRHFRVRANTGLPALQPDALLVVDIASTRFEGAGLYLYPAWGCPRPYLVQVEADGTLLFSRPGSPEVLWRQRLDGDADRFAGRILSIPGADEWWAIGIPPLQVPTLPLA